MTATFLSLGRQMTHEEQRELAKYVYKVHRRPR